MVVIVLTLSGQKKMTRAFFVQSGNTGFFDLA